MYCKHCGANLNGNETNCPLCGNIVEHSSTETATPVPPVVETPTQTENSFSAQPQMQQNEPTATRFCVRCGQKLMPGANLCAFCSMPVNAPNSAQTPPYAYAPQPVQKKGTGLAIGGIIGGLFFPILGIILGVIAINQGSKTKNTVAVILGVISIIIGAINWIINIVMLMNDPNYFPDSGTQY